MATVLNVTEILKRSDGSEVRISGDAKFYAQSNYANLLLIDVEDGGSLEANALINFTPQTRQSFTSHDFFVKPVGIVTRVVNEEIISAYQYAIQVPKLVLQNNTKEVIESKLTFKIASGTNYRGYYATLSALNTALPPTEELETDKAVAYVVATEEFYQVLYNSTSEAYEWTIVEYLDMLLVTKQYSLSSIYIQGGFSSPQGIAPISASNTQVIMSILNDLQVLYGSLNTQVNNIDDRTDFIEKSTKTLTETIQMEYGSIGESGELLEVYDKLRSKDFLSTIPTRVITFNNNMSYNMYVVAYDENKNYISTSLPIVGSGTYTTPTGAYYLKIRTSTNQTSVDAVFTYSFSGSVVSMVADIIYNKNGEIEKLKVTKIDLGNGYKMYSDLIEGETDLYEAVIEALENEFNIFTLKAPTRNPKEATLALKINGDGVTNQFVDISCMRYNNAVQGSVEIVMQKRGTTTPLPYFSINFNDGLGAGRVKKFTVQPDAIPIEMVSTGIKVRRNNNYNNTGSEAEYQVINLTDLYDDVEDLKEEIILKADKTYVDTQDQALDDYFENEITKIKDGTTIVKKAEQDKNSNDIVATYETKSDATSKKLELDGEIDVLNERVGDLEEKTTQIYDYKGSVLFANLPTTGQVIGDVYNILDNFTLGGEDYLAGTDVAWNGTGWNALGSHIPNGDEVQYSLGVSVNEKIDTKLDSDKVKTSFSTPPLDTNVISEKLAKDSLDIATLNATKPFIMPALQFPNYDTATKTLDFKSDATFKAMLYYGKEKYDIPVGTVVVDNNGTTAVQLIFNTVSKVFSFIPHTQILANNELRVAVYKRLANFYEWDFPCDLTVDGVNVKKEYARFATISFTTNIPNYDIESKTLTFLSTGLPMKLIYGFENYDLPNSFSLTLPTASSIHNLLFDTKTKTLYFQIWSTQIRPVDVYLGTIRTLTGIVDCNFTFPVTINNQVVYARKNIDGENQLWYRSLITNIIDSNQNKKFNNNISFVFLTDTHISSANKYRLQHYGNLSKFVKSKSIDFSVYGGDIVEGDDVSKETTKRYISEVCEISTNEKDTFVIFGNHDDNSYYTTSPLLSNMVNKKELHDRILAPLSNNVVHDTLNSNSGYYYKDIENKKIRLIFLDYLDYPVMDNGGGVAKWSGRNYWGYGARQVTWLETEASNIPVGYKVIVFSHGPSRATLNAFGAEVKNGAPVEGILNAISTGGAFTGGTTGTDYDVSVDCDFTSQGARKVLAFVHGHTHADYIIKPSGLDFVYVSVANSSDSVVDTGSIPVGATRPTTRAQGATTEDLWDVFNIDIDSGDINITRFGAGNDRTYEA